MHVVFDVNGTLTDPAGLAEPWDRPQLGRAMLDGAVRGAMLDAIAQAYRPFDEHLRSSIEWHAREQGLELGLVDAAAERAAALDPWPDAAEALGLLQQAGHTLHAFTNSGADAGRSTLEDAGLAARFDRILGVDAVQRSKPHPATYAYLLNELGAPAGDVLLVAAHDWDVDGAARAGLQTAWVGRDEHGLSAVIRSPTEQGASLLDVARAVADRLR